MKSRWKEGASRTTKTWWTQYLSVSRVPSHFYLLLWAYICWSQVGCSLPSSSPAPASHIIQTNGSQPETIEKQVPVLTKNITTGAQLAVPNSSLKYRNFKFHTDFAVRLLVVISVVCVVITSLLFIRMLSRRRRSKKNYGSLPTSADSEKQMIAIVDDYEDDDEEELVFDSSQHKLIKN